MIVASIVSGFFFLAYRQSNQELFWPKTICTPREIIPVSFSSTVSAARFGGVNEQANKHTHLHPIALEEGLFLPIDIRLKKRTLNFLQHSILAQLIQNGNISLDSVVFDQIRKKENKRMYIFLASLSVPQLYPTYLYYIFTFKRVLNFDKDFFIKSADSYLLCSQAGSVNWFRGFEDRLGRFLAQNHLDVT